MGERGKHANCQTNFRFNERPCLKGITWIVVEQEKMLYLLLKVYIRTREEEQCCVCSLPTSPQLVNSFISSQALKTTSSV